ncbi:MAG TPA: hypothetical protein VF712_07225 [Thermoleophilaceae bacterium]|jgi:hypothetical protein
MAVSSDMGLLFERLRNDPVTQAEFEQNRAQATAGYQLTTHERDAVMTSDCDDLVALGLAGNVASLPASLECPEPSRPTIAPGLIDRITGAVADVIRPIRDRVPLPDRLDLPRPFRRRPPPPPQPRPGPRPPRPTPGPDPPPPDRGDG